MRNKKLAAQLYGQRGWRVTTMHNASGGACFCRKKECKGKRPVLNDWPISATTDRAQIEQWFDSNPRYNVGIVTGKASDLWVLDLDGPKAMAELDRLQEVYGTLPKTPAVLTSRGRHLYFRYPLDSEIGNAQKVGGFTIDVRGDGGCVMAPPSEHPSGTEYAWEVSPEDCEVAYAPTWLTDWVRQEKPSSTAPPDAAPDGDVDTPYFGALDLRTHPGTSEGDRNGLATRLVGAEFGRGTLEPEVRALALDWNDRNDPPMDAWEVNQVVDSIFRKEVRALEERLEGVTPTPEKPWPKLGEAAYHGVLGEAVRAIEPETEADPAAVLVQLLVMFGNSVGKTANVMVGPGKEYANLFAVVVGATAKARKGTSSNVAEALFGPELSARIKSGLSSGEGVISQVTDAVYKQVSDRKSGASREVIDIPEAKDKRLLVLESEYGSVLKVMRREGNTLSDVVRNAWDGRTLSTMTKVPRSATGAHVSIIGHITEQELRHLMLDVHLFNGFANRFLWVAAKRSKVLPNGGNPRGLEEFGRRIREAVAAAQKFGTVTWDADAAAYWDGVYRGELSREYPGVLGAVMGRAEGNARRLSLVYALADSSPVIKVPHIKAAMAVWAYAVATTLMIFGDSTEGGSDDELVAFMRKQKPFTTDLYRFSNNRCSKQELHAKLSRLIGQNRVRFEKVKTGGRPAMQWSVIEP